MTDDTPDTDADSDATDATTRTAGILSVASVVSVTGWMSYWHIVAVVTHHGEPGVSGHLFPVLIDGTLLAASSVLTSHARKHVRAPFWAWVAVGLGIASTCSFNVLYGLSQGWLSALIAALVSVTLLVNVELLMMLIHGPARKKAVSDEAAVIPEPVSVTVIPEPVITHPAPDTDTDTPETDTDMPDPVTTARMTPAEDDTRPDSELTVAELAKRHDVSERTIYRGRARAAKASSKADIEAASTLTVVA